MTGPRPYITSEFNQFFSTNPAHLTLLIADAERPIETGVPAAPWMKSPVYEQNLTGLHDEIIDLSDWLQPTHEEQIMRQIAFIRAKAYLYNMYPASIVDLYGSVATGVYLPDSDLDISVSFKGRTTVDYYRIADYFRQNGSYRDIHVRVKSSIPLVKLVDEISNFPIDITFNVGSNSAVEWVKRQIANFPDLARLVLVIKKMLAVYNLNEPFNGGLSSYALVILMAHYLNYNSHLYRRHKPLGLILMKFLCFYGEEFDYLSKAVIFNGHHALFIDKATLQQQNENFIGSSMLTIVDPVDQMNDVGRGAHRMVVIKGTFLMLKRMLLLTLQEKAIVHQGSMISLVVPIAPSELASRRTVVRNVRHIKTLTSNSHSFENSSLLSFIYNSMPNNLMLQFPCAFPFPLGVQLPYHTNKSGEAVYTTAGSPPVVNSLASQYSLEEPMVSSSVAPSSFPTVSSPEIINMFMPPITFNSFRPSIAMPNRLMLPFAQMALNDGTSHELSVQNSSDIQNMSRTSDSSEDSAVEVDQPLYNWEKGVSSRMDNNNGNPQLDGINVISNGLNHINLTDQRNCVGPKLSLRQKKLYG